ncbi:MAG: LysR substrate-binding domain-containing protein [Pseudomonadota bacterium]
MDLRWLDDVLVLLEEGNMTRAAARRNITQPAFSRRIKGFEAWLKTDVLERKTNSVAIHPALAANEEEIRALTRQLRDLRTKITHFEPEAPTVAIAAQHAPVFSIFPDMAQRAKEALPRLKFRLRAGNLNDCVSLFLRGEASMLLCYAAPAADPLAFGPDVAHVSGGEDALIPVIGGQMRQRIAREGRVPDDTPAIVYPEGSYFGAVLSRSERPFSTVAHSQDAVCVTALSSGIQELVLKGLGVGWVPLSMASRGLESGALVSLANDLGREPLTIALYADTKVPAAIDVLTIWSRGS